MKANKGVLVTVPASAVSCGLYLRLSKEDLKGKTTNMDSIAVQRADGIEAIKLQGWNFDEKRHLFIDDDVSGRLVKRDAWSDMLGAAARGEFTILVLRDMERFARYEPARQMKTLIELLDMGVRVWTYKDKAFIRLSGPESIVTYAKAIASEQYVESIRTNTKAALKSRVLAGLAVKKPPFGYVIEDRGREGLRWAIVDAKAAVVIRVAELTLATGSKNGAVKKLNSMGMSAPAGGPWRISSLTKVLSQPLYRGVYHHGGETVLHPELRIFDHELEARVDEFLSKKSKPWGSTPRHLSTRFVRCGVCSGCLVATM
ncbi:MAG: recombinase family protein [Polyangiaceae bacterium]